MIQSLAGMQEGMTGSERRILDLILRDPRAFALTPIEALARELDLSKTTLLRFSRLVGFSGFAHFRKVLQEETILNSGLADKLLLRVKEGAPDLLDDIFREDIHNLEGTWARLDREKLDDLVLALHDAPQIFVMGWGLSAFFAELLATRLQLAGIRAEAVTKQRLLLRDHVSRMRKDDILIVFEFPYYVREVLEAVEAAKAKGIQIACVTDKENCPLLPHARWSFFCQTRSALFVNSPTAPIFFVQLLASLLLVRSKGQSLAAFKTLDASNKEDGNYIV